MHLHVDACSCSGSHSESQFGEVVFFNRETRLGADPVYLQSAGRRVSQAQGESKLQNQVVSAVASSCRSFSDVDEEGRQNLRLDLEPIAEWTR